MPLFVLGTCDGAATWVGGRDGGRSCGFAHSFGNRNDKWLPLGALPAFLPDRLSLRRVICILAGWEPPLSALVSPAHPSPLLSRSHSSPTLDGAACPTATLSGALKPLNPTGTAENDHRVTKRLLFLRGGGLGTRDTVPRPLDVLIEWARRRKGGGDDRLPALLPGALSPRPRGPSTSPEGKRLREAGSQSTSADSGAYRSQGGQLHPEGIRGEEGGWW